MFCFSGYSHCNSTVGLSSPVSNAIRLCTDVNSDASRKFPKVFRKLSHCSVFQSNFLCFDFLFDRKISFCWSSHFMTTCGKKLSMTSSKVNRGKASMALTETFLLLAGFSIWFKMFCWLVWSFWRIVCRHLTFQVSGADRKLLAFFVFHLIYETAKKKYTVFLKKWNVYSRYF